MIVVISQAWTKPEEAHVHAYVQLNEEFGQFFRDHPGFRGRQLVRGTEDPTHFTHLRWFDTLEDYEECTRQQGYVEHTVKMYEHLVPYESYPREIVEVVFDERPAPHTGDPA
ncbi:antibiotic biosynthesis monooxygenase family protein [Nocardioides yefusunii]|uniref:Antibiotic biosynthesis monooxygenase family protein n=1 Tax=Nocardioides yefusunii TaxID=2500546 RepID=A0ABW1QVJ8_9ACTN|nr:antibiotic biosynthesis monooxygenase [Nocardioides yefusunii]